jgi:chemotaxis signal transduction protein
MSDATKKEGGTARALRDAFDRSFAELPATKPVTASFLAVRIGGDPYALRLSDIAGLHRDKPIVPAANVLPDLLGMAGFRGIVAPVYDLAVLLGYPRAKAPRWLVLAGKSALVALAFEIFEAHLQVELGELSAAVPSSTRPHLEGALRDEEGTRALIRVASIVEAILLRARSGGPAKER